MEILLSILAFILVLSVLIFVHEFGHFIVAKRAGIKVEEFALGFPPRIWGKQVGETLYAINALPIGGYVRLFGEDEPTEKEKSRSFFAQSPGVKLAVAFAGALMNFVLGVFLLAVVYMNVGLPGKSLEKVVVLGTDPGSPADRAMIKPLDQLISVDGREISRIEDVYEIIWPNTSGQEMEVKIRRAKNAELLMDAIYEKGGEVEEITLRVAPQTREVENPETGAKEARGVIGIAPEIVPVKTTEFLPWHKMIFLSVHRSFEDSIEFSKKILSGLGGIVGKMFTERKVSDDVTGPVGIYEATSYASQLGWLPVVFLTGILSINLALLNALPFPGLDGGRALFIVLQTVTRNRINPEIEKNIHLVGIALLLAFILLVSMRDIGRYF